MDFDFTDTGTGPALLFLPGSYSTGAAWKGVQQALSGSYRMITTSMPGYGGSREVRKADGRDMSPITEFVANVAARIDQPVHLIAHSWGGLAALAATLDGAISPRSLITFEGNPMYVRPPDGDFPWLLDMARCFEAAHAAGDPDAPGIIIDYWSKPGFFAAMPEPVQSYCRTTVASNILDWRAAAGFTPTIAEFAALDMPCTLVRGEHANPALAEVTDRLAQEIPDCTVKVVNGAGHFLITTHAADCAAIIDAHMAAL